MISSLETLNRFRASGFREAVEVFEHKAPTELVAPTDIIRTDSLGRTVCACAAGQTPAHWLLLSEQEREQLVEPLPEPPDGTLEPGHCGFTPKNTVVGRWTIEQPA